MFIGYMKDMKSWILFFLGTIGFIDLVLWLDQGIIVEVTSILYFNILLLLFFIVFLAWRYYVEMKFTKELVLLIDGQFDDWDVALPDPVYLRDKKTREILLQGVEQLSKRLSTLKQASISDSDYIASWVHEVKTPLTAMKLLIDEHRGDPVIRKVELEWLRLHLLIDRQLSISRLPTLEADYILEKGNLQQLVKAEVRELASWFMEKNIAVEFEGAEDAEVVTDSKWCRFLIRQLLTNAVKYSPSGGTITIWTSELETENMQLIITDEGPGIKAHDLPRIFDKGFTGGTGRIHNAATGLGLYLAKTVATKIGITMMASSENSKGTSMEIIFPTKNDFDKILK